MEEEKIKLFQKKVIQFENQTIPVSSITRIETTEEYSEEAPEGLSYNIIIHMPFPPYHIDFGFFDSKLRDRKKSQLLKKLESAGWKLMVEDSNE